jgi:hypothetical protein
MKAERLDSKSLGFFFFFIKNKIDEKSIHDAISNNSFIFGQL